MCLFGVVVRNRVKYPVYNSCIWSPLHTTRSPPPAVTHCLNTYPCTYSHREGGEGLYSTLEFGRKVVYTVIHNLLWTCFRSVPVHVDNFFSSAVSQARPNSLGLCKYVCGLESISAVATTESTMSTLPRPMCPWPSFLGYCIPVSYKVLGRCVEGLLYKMERYTHFR